MLAGLLALLAQVIIKTVPQVATQEIVESPQLGFHWALRVLTVEAVVRLALPQVAPSDKAACAEARVCKVQQETPRVSTILELQEAHNHQRAAAGFQQLPPILLAVQFLQAQRMYMQAQQQEQQVEAQEMTPPLLAPVHILAGFQQAVAATFQGQAATEEMAYTAQAVLAAVHH